MEVQLVPGTATPADSTITAGWGFTLYLWAPAHASQPAGDEAEALLDWIEDGGDPNTWYAAWRERNPGPDMEQVKAQALAVYHAQVERAPERHRLELRMRAERHRRYERMVKRATATPRPASVSPERRREHRSTGARSTRAGRPATTLTTNRSRRLSQLPRVTTTATLPK